MRWLGQSDLDHRLRAVFSSTHFNRTFFFVFFNTAFLSKTFFLLIASNVNGGIVVMNPEVKPLVETLVKSHTSSR